MGEPRYNVETLDQLSGLRDAQPGDRARVACVPRRPGPVLMQLEQVCAVAGAVWSEDRSSVHTEALSAS